jgi:hypothetical protein
LLAGASFFDNNLVSLLQNITIWIIFDIGMLICTAQLTLAVKRDKTIKDMYTRVMVPSFVFLIFADIYMVILALLHGTLPFSLFKKDGVLDPTANKKVRYFPACLYFLLLAGKMNCNDMV